MKLIVGLGNPDAQYALTRHNAGYFVLDLLATKYGLRWDTKTKFHSIVTSYTLAGEPVLFVKPTTYYNESGRAMRSLMDFYSLSAEDCLVIHDELSLPIGRMRLRTGGSAGGNNGVKSINAHGGEQTRRVRLGIANEYSQRTEAKQFVLRSFSKSERETIAAFLPDIENALEAFVLGNFENHSISLETKNTTL